MPQMFGRWSSDEIRAAADIAKEKGVAVRLLTDGSILIGEACKPDDRADLEDSTLQPEPMPNAFSPATLAKRWHCSEQHVRNLINNGSIAHHRLGGKLLRISAEEVERIEREGTREQ